MPSAPPAYSGTALVTCFVASTTSPARPHLPTSTSSSPALNTPRRRQPRALLCPLVQHFGAAMSGLRRMFPSSWRPRRQRALSARRIRNLVQRSGDAGAPGRRDRWTGPEPGVPRRVFFPAGGSVRTWSSPDERPLLPSGLPERLRDAIEGSLVGRAGRLSRFDIAVLDSDLADHPAPARTAAVAGGLRTLERGALAAIPDSDAIRLFLHWTQPHGLRVDLDLSAIFYDEHWNRIGFCDYTQLRSSLGALHSGDLTSAPAPEGATEYVDLDVSALRAAGVRRVVPVIFSFNNVPFETMNDSFTGFLLPEPEGPVFNPARVAVRVDLVGSIRSLVPMVVDLAEQTMRWAELSVAGRGHGNSVARNEDSIALAAMDLELAFGHRRRATVADLAVVHATGRVAEIVIRHGAEDFRDPTGNRLQPPDLAGRAVLFVATRSLPKAVGDVGSGSVLVCATTNDPLASATTQDLVDALRLMPPRNRVAVGTCASP